MHFLRILIQMYQAFEAVMTIRGSFFLFFFLRLVGGPPIRPLGMGPQAAAYLCLYVKTATVKGSQ